MNIASSITHAPEPSQSSSKNSAEALPTHLTLNGVLNMRNAQAKALQSNQNLVLQVTTIKLFSPEETKNKIKEKITLSDGATTIRALITENLFEKLVS